MFDFYRSLRRDPARLRVLGDGRQRKSYLYVHDCIDAILLVLERAHDRVNVFNLGADEYCEVNDSIAWIVGHLGLDPEPRTRAVSAAGLVTARSFFSMRAGCVRSAGSRSSPSVQVSSGPSSTSRPIHG